MSALEAQYSTILDFMNGIHVKKETIEKQAVSE